MVSAKRRESSGGRQEARGCPPIGSPLVRWANCRWPSLIQPLLSGAPDPVLRHVEAGALEHLRVLLEFEQVFNGADGAVAFHRRGSIERRRLEAGEREDVAEGFAVLLGHHVLP